MNFYAPLSKVWVYNTNPKGQEYIKRPHYLV